MASKLRQTILDAEDIQTEIIDVPQWDTKVEVRGMTGRERARLLKTTAKDGEVNMEKWFPDLLIATLYDPETGDKVFGAADRDALNKKSGSAIAAIADVAARLSGLGDVDVQAAKEDLPAES